MSPSANGHAAAAPPRLLGRSPAGMEYSDVIAITGAELSFAAVSELVGTG